MRGGVNHQKGLTSRKLAASQLTSYTSPAEREAAARGGPCPVMGCFEIIPPAHAHQGQIVSWHSTDPPERDAMDAPHRGAFRAPSRAQDAGRVLPGRR